MTSKHKALQAKYFSIIAELGIVSPFHFDQKGESSVCSFTFCISFWFMIGYIANTVQIWQHMFIMKL